MARKNNKDTNIIGDTILGTGAIAGGIGTYVGSNDLRIKSNKISDISDNLTESWIKLNNKSKHVKNTDDARDVYMGVADFLDIKARNHAELSGMSSSVPNFLLNKTVPDDWLKYIKQDTNKLHTDAVLNLGSLVDPGLAERVRNMNPKDYNKIINTGDTITKLRALGVRDYDIQQKILNSAPEISAFLKKTKKEVIPSIGVAGDIARKVNLGSKIGIGLGGATAALGAYSLFKGSAEKKLTNQIKDVLNNNPINTVANQIKDKVGDNETKKASTAALIGGAGLTTAGAVNAARPTNKNILLSYGTADSLGAGHKTPGDALAKIIRESPMLRDYKVDINPLNVHGTRAVYPDLLDKKYLAGIDTGWGFSNFKGVNRWSNPSATKNIRTDEDIKNVLHTIQFDPDPLAKKTGTLAEKFFPSSGRDAITYGDKEAYGDINPADKGVHFVGKYHPGVSVDRAVRLERPQYVDMVGQYMAGTMGVPPTDLTTGQKAAQRAFSNKISGKKIITVSGASRGDSVGVRVKRLHDALTDSGQIDDYFIVGLGGKTANIQKSIAGGGDTKALKNTFIGGFAPNTELFTSLANNSDLHYMGLGGATPVEMLMHGGAPIMVDKNEQVFMHRQSNKLDDLRKFIKPDKQNIGWRRYLHHNWTMGGGRPKLMKEQGLGGRERDAIRKTIDAIRGNSDDPSKKLLKVLRDRLNNPDSRFWMNPISVGKEGDSRVVDRGLDSLRELLDEHGVAEVLTPGGADKSKFGTAADPILDVINNSSYSKKSLKGKDWTGIGDEVLEGVRGSHEGTAKVLKQLFRKAATKQRVSRFMKAGGPIGLLLGLGSMPLAYAAYTNNKGKGMRKRSSAENDDMVTQLTNLAKGTTKNKKNNLYSDLAVGTAATGLGGFQVYGGTKGALAGQGMIDLADSSLKKSTKDKSFMDLVDYFDEYGSRSQKAINANSVLGLKPKTFMNTFPPSYIMSSKNKTKAILWSTLSKGLSDKQANKWVKKFLSDDEYKAFKDSRAHYSGFADNPRIIQVAEMLGGNERFSKIMKDNGIDLMSKDNRTLRQIIQNAEDTGVFKRKPAIKRLLNRALVGHHNFFNRTGFGPAAYGPWAKRVGIGSAVVGAGLGSYGIYRYIKAMMDNKKNKGNTMIKKSAEGDINPLQSVLAAGPSGMPERPGDPALGAPLEEATESPDTRKVVISDKGMDGKEIKMTVESSVENDARVSFLASALTQSIGETDASGREASENEAPIPEPAEEAIMPAQGQPLL